MTRLNCSDALKLLSWNAFQQPCPPEEYAEVSQSMLNYAKALPLALKILGSFLRGKSVVEWQWTINKLKKISNPEIFEILKVSFNGLEDYEKVIFLDIACFFRRMMTSYIIEVLNSCDLCADIGIRVLADRSLITIDDGGRVDMHDLIQQMGREIVSQESADPGKRSRIWFHEDVLEVLEENTGTNAIEGMVVDIPGITEVCMNPNAFQQMKRLRLLFVRNTNFSCGPNYLPNQLRWLDWSNYPSPSLPFDFRPKKLASLKLQFAHITQLWDGLKVCSNMTFLELRECKSFCEVSDVSTIANLKELVIHSCTSLVKVHESVGFLDKLVSLDIQDCSKLMVLPSKLRLTSLRRLLLSDCASVKRFPDILDSMVHVCTLWLDGTGIEELPPSIGNLTGLEDLHLHYCENLQALPSSIHSLQNLRRLELTCCIKFHGFLSNGDKRRHFIACDSNSEALVSPELCCSTPELGISEGLRYFSKLEIMDLIETNLVSLPSCIGHFVSLTHLYLDECRLLIEILELPPNLILLRGRHCESLEKVELKNLRMETRIKIDFSNCHKLGVSETAENFLHQIYLTRTYSSTVQSQMEEICNIEDFMLQLPGGEIPNWCYHRSREGNSVALKVHPSLRKKLNGLAVCIVFCSREDLLLHCDLYINGRRAGTQKAFSGILESDHVWLLYFRIPQYIKEQDQDGWELFKLSFPFAFQTGAKVKEYGVRFVYTAYEDEASNPSVAHPCYPRNSVATQEEAANRSASTMVTRRTLDREYSILHLDADVIRPKKRCRAV